MEPEKSTTLGIILGLIKADSGQVKIFGEEIKDSDILNRVGVVLDDNHLPGEMKIKNVAKFCSLCFDNWEADKFEGYLKRFKLSEKQKVKTLSRGMRMKLSLSIALSHKADLMILDEATSGLDPVVREEIIDILMDFLQDENHTVLISSHILSDLEKGADYIAFIHEGKILFMEEKDKLLEEYGLCSLSKEALKDINPAAIVAKRENAFGINLLVKKDLVPTWLDLKKPSIEDVMIYIIKGDNNESLTL